MVMGLRWVVRGMGWALLVKVMAAEAQQTMG
jgi:hypothetical protein